ncbi:polyprenyl diphosphate synthase [Halocatena salina]|uniref:Tritrans,polycis-undecaprenyl-diphosphate synthase (geranylgeranyl-diphosphate specific) n=1 Tax=Halocatena salina TaxID=2934340 RepID=A0A8U0A294_9EURY|nr:polyprenyl diphosphate synthase [Halocatena salina]UPM43285.1 polyprenyl diphosphate synthase [Halocatena salina]
MLRRFRRWALDLYERNLEREFSGVPSHIAVIQDGNRRYADERGEGTAFGHREGVKTTESILEWCADLGVEELTLYTFSTENFNRPPDQRKELFDLIESKLKTFADEPEIHERGVHIRAIGQITRLPERVRDAIEYAESKTADYDRFHLNIALAYGGRAELLDAARDAAAAVERGDLSPAEIDIDDIEKRLYSHSGRDVDLIIRTGGAERTSNFLPWHANGNEAAVFFCTPYWPEFRRIDLLRAIRTYESRQQSWRRTRVQRAITLVRVLGSDDGLRSRLRRQVGEFDGFDIEDDPTPKQ